MNSRTARRRERQRRKYKQWFHLYEVEYFIRDEYPRCPEFAVVRFAHQVCTEPKNWRGVSIAVAVDRVMQNMLRHELTDYDQMLLVGIRRREARRRVEPRVRAMMASWKSENDTIDTAYKRNCARDSPLKPPKSQRT